MRPAPTKPFRSDGCTMFPDGDWGECCLEHDRVYWLGGTRQERLAADVKLRCCVAERGHPVIAVAMFVGVRIGGWGYWPTRHRWGFGHRWPRGYFKPEREERHGRDGRD